jgi:hypothetical protein
VDRWRHAASCSCCVSVHFGDIAIEFGNGESVASGQDAVSFSVLRAGPKYERSGELDRCTSSCIGLITPGTCPHLRFSERQQHSHKAVRLLGSTRAPFPAKPAIRAQDRKHASTRLIIHPCPILSLPRPTLIAMKSLPSGLLARVDMPVIRRTQRSPV